MSRREYKTINRRLQRGRIASLDEGKYIAGTPPYGYKKVKIAHQKGYTLEIVPEQAEVVREIFRLYTVGDPRPDGTVEPIGSYAIANQLNARNIPSPGGVKWSASSVRDILKNPTYAGFVRWSYRAERKQMVDGSVVVSHPVSADHHLKKGLHDAIITELTCRLHSPHTSTENAIHNSDAFRKKETADHSGVSGWPAVLNWRDLPV